MHSRGAMKILLVHNLYRSGTPGGEDVVFEQEKKLLENAGHEVLTYTRSNDEMNESNPLDALQVLGGLHHSTRTQRELTELLRARRPDIVHFHNIFPLISASGYDACVEQRVPVVQSVHNYRTTCSAGTHFRAGRVCESCHAGEYWAAVRHACYRGSAVASAAVASMLLLNQRRNVLRFVDRFFVLGEFAAQRLMMAGVDRERIVVKPNFVPDRGHFPSAAPLAQRTPAYAFFSGRLAVEKGVETVCAAWRSLPAIPLKICGDGPLSASLRQRAAAERLNIEFLGMQSRERVMELAAGARLQVVSSEWFEAGVPLVALEAWAQGTPVVAARIGGLAEMGDEASPDGAALQFEPGDPLDLAHKVSRLWSDDVLANRLAARGRARFESASTPERSLAILESTYRTLCASAVAA